MRVRTQEGFTDWYELFGSLEITDIKEKSYTRISNSLEWTKEQHLGPLVWFCHLFLRNSRPVVLKGSPWLKALASLG